MIEMINYDEPEKEQKQEKAIQSVAQTSDKSIADVFFERCQIQTRFQPNLRAASERCC